MSRRVRDLGSVAAVAVALATAAGGGALEAQTPGPSARPAQKPLPLPAARTAEFTATEATWMSVDVSPDGQTPCPSPAVGRHPS